MNHIYASNKITSALYLVGQSNRPSTISRFSIQSIVKGKKNKNKNTHKHSHTEKQTYHIIKSPTVNYDSATN